MKGGKDKNSKDNNVLSFPDHEIEALARCFLPAMREYFESKEGQKEFEEWQGHLLGKKQGKTSKSE